MAVKYVREDRRSAHRASEERGMPYSTLQKRLKQGPVSAAKMVRKPVILEGREQAITDNLLSLSST
jgi:hypothetical protein